MTDVLFTVWFVGFMAACEFPVANKRETWAAIGVRSPAFAIAILLLWPIALPLLGMVEFLRGGGRR